MNKRKAMIGYVTYRLGRRMAERLVRRKVKRHISALLSTPQRSSLRRRLPLVGAVAALAAAAGVVFVRRS